jgi:hypothetical protein
MRSPDDQIVFNTLDFLAQINAQIDGFRQQLRQATDLMVASFIESRYYGNDLYVCVCLETDVDLGKTLTWWLDIRPRADGWRLEASMLWNGRDVVVQFPSQLVHDFPAVQQAVPLLLGQLFEAGGRALVKARPELDPQSDLSGAQLLD